jgi:hypothetical protein
LKKAGVQSVVANAKMLRLHTLILHHVASHSLAIHDYGVDETIGEAEHPLLPTAAQQARRALAR